MQRRLVQLELAARQLQGETEEHARERLDEIEQEMKDLRAKLAKLREQWELEKSGVGDVQQSRAQLSQAELEFEQLSAAIQAKQSGGEFVTEDDYRRLYELDQKKKMLTAQLESAGTKTPVATGRRLGGWWCVSGVFSRR